MDEMKEIMNMTLPEDQRKIADLIGLEAYAKLVDVYGGMQVYVMKKDSLVRGTRDERIRQRFDGTNYRHLAAEFNLSEVRIRYIVADIDREMRSRQIDLQEIM